MIKRIRLYFINKKISSLETQLQILLINANSLPIPDKNEYKLRQLDADIVALKIKIDKYKKYMRKIKKKVLLNQYRRNRNDVCR